MKTHSIAALGGLLMFSAGGCVTAYLPPETTPSENSQMNHTGVPLTNGRLIEIVVVKHRENDRTQVVLTRDEIVDVLGIKHPILITNGWNRLELDEDSLIRSWLPGKFDSAENRRRAEVRLIGITVRRPYTFSDLGVTNSQELLEKFFENQTGLQNGWWVEKNTPEGNSLRQTDFIATLKAHEFELTRGDAVPVLLARPKSE